MKCMYWMVECRSVTSRVGGCAVYRGNGIDAAICIVLV